MEKKNIDKKDVVSPSTATTCSAARYRREYLFASDIARRAVLRSLYLRGREETTGAVSSFAEKAISKRRVKFSAWQKYLIVREQIKLLAERGAIKKFEHRATEWLTLPKNRTRPLTAWTRLG